MNLNAEDLWGGGYEFTDKPDEWTPGEEEEEYDPYEYVMEQHDLEMEAHLNPVPNNMQQVAEEAEEHKPNNVKNEPKPPRKYKKGKNAPANNPNYDDNEIWKLYLEDKSYREIARILNIKSHNTVRNRINKIMFNER